MGRSAPPPGEIGLMPRTLNIFKEYVLVIWESLFVGTDKLPATDNFVEWLFSYLPGQD